MSHPADAMSPRERVKYETRRHYSADYVRYYQRRMYASAHMQHYLQTRTAALHMLLERCENALQRRLRVLEVGCGPGLSLLNLSQGSRHHFCGMDLSPEMLLLARENITEVTPRPVVLRASALHLPFANGAFDFVYATRFIHMFREKAPVLAELRRVVHTGGMVVIEFYHRPYHLLRWLTGRHPVALSNFLYHYPRVSEVRRLLGKNSLIIPLRFGGERLLTVTVGEPVVRRMLAGSWRWPMRLAVDEYFAAVPGQGGTR